MNLGMPELIFIFVLALLIFGPKKLPELGKSLGKGLAEFKRASNELKSSLEEEINSVHSSAKEAFGEPAKLLEGVLDTKPGAEGRPKLEASASTIPEPVKENATPAQTSTPNPSTPDHG